MDGPGDRSARIVAAALRGWAADVHARRSWLTELDAAIGDGDHGINLDRGLAALTTDLDSGAIAIDEAGAVLGAAGRRLIGVVGGASGALYGRALVRAGAAVAAADGTDRLAELALAAAIDAIADLGHAVAGDKTMLDALLPALAVMRDRPAGEPTATALRRAADAADAGALATFSLVARKGRASYLGQRSVGHLDPGAASSAMLIRSVADASANA